MTSSKLSYQTNLITNTNLDKITSTEVSEYSINRIISNPAYDENDLNNYLRNYSYNTTGFCGVTAAAIMLMYYDDYYNDNYVASQYQTADGVQFIEYLRTVIPNDGHFDYNVVNGLNQYLSSRGLSTRAYSTTSWASKSIEYGRLCFY